MHQDDGRNGSRDSIQWEYFVNRDKVASPQFDELCRGLAFVIRKLQPTQDVDLSPQRLANFYRKCGANLDEIFTNTGEHGLSFLYRTLGCYHSLQPTPNPFETPSIPCLTDDGYVRWQTLQLLLCPDEHAAVIQQAAKIFDLPRKRGGFFPKTIPRECFPARPDADMEKWTRFVTSQMSSDQQRLKNSPWQSPQPEDKINSMGGYFAQAPPVRKSSQSRKRESLSEEELARREAARRRSSVPDIASPGGGFYAQTVLPPAGRSKSANRPGSGPNSHHQRQRSYTSGQAPYPSSKHRPSQSVSSHRLDSNNSVDRSYRRESRYQRDASSGSRMSTASDASSERSYRERKSRPAEEDGSRRRSRWGTSLMPSFFLSNSKRRHSSDGRVPTLRNDKRSPRRSESIRKYKTEGPDHASPQQRFDSPRDRSSSGVRFSNVFNPADPPLRPEDKGYPPPPPQSGYRYSEPQPHVSPPLGVPNSNAPNTGFRRDPLPNAPNVSAATLNQFDARRQGFPVRISTNSGVNGRRYAQPETRSAVEPAVTNRRDRAASWRNPATSTAL